jgi:hypothetical protein
MLLQDAWNSLVPWQSQFPELQEVDMQPMKTIASSHEQAPWKAQRQSFDIVCHSTAEAFPSAIFRLRCALLLTKLTPMAGKAEMKQQKSVDTPCLHSMSVELR